MDAHTEVLPDWQQVSREDPRLAGLYDRLLERRFNTRVPGKLLGDILTLLGAGRRSLRIDTRSTEHYGNFLKQVTRGRRWKTLVLRLAMLKRRVRVGRFARESHGGGEGAWEASMICAVSQVAHNFFDVPHEEGLADLALVGHIADIQMRKWKKTSGREAAGIDPSEVLVDNYVMVLTELAAKARVLQAFEIWANTPLIKKCLEVVWKAENFIPRQLEVVKRDGEIELRSAGEISGVRGITKKIREDQIPKILPSEFALMGHKSPDVPDAGLLLTLDKIFNRAPLIEENYNPERPEIRHRICLPIIIHATDHEASFAEADQPANRIRVLAFELLTHLALQMPHDRIQADVVWFDYQPEIKGQWDVSLFPLRALTVTASKQLGFTNVLQVSKLLPTFFAKGMGGARTDHPYEVRKLQTSPSSYLHGVVASAAYRGIYPAVLTVRDQRNICLPPATTQLPRPSGERHPHVMVVQCNWFDPGDGAPAGTSPATHFEALFAPTLLSAWTSSPPYAVSNPRLIVSNFLEMVIGPQEELARLPTA